MAVEKGALKGLFITFLIVEAFSLPVFRSGGRGDLTAVQWVKEHTIFGSPIQYVPEEDYVRELQNAREAEEARFGA